MARRNYWSGYLKLSLVTCPVAMMPATTEGEKVRFHTLNRKTQNRVASRYVDEASEKPVDSDDIARAYPLDDDRNIIIEDEELEAVALESTRTIDIETFVPADSIGWVWQDKPHYLVPDDKVGEEAFAVIREAMADAGVVGISRLVMYRRERAVMLEPRGRGIVLWTLRYGDEVRDADDYFSSIGAEKPKQDAAGLVRKLIDARTADWDPKMVGDPVQDRLLELIEARRKGKRRKGKAAPREADSSGDNVINIMDALRKSLAKESG